MPSFASLNASQTDSLAQLCMQQAFAVPDSDSEGLKTLRLTIESTPAVALNLLEFMRQAVAGEMDVPPPVVSGGLTLCEKLFGAVPTGDSAPDKRFLTVVQAVKLSKSNALKEVREKAAAVYADLLPQAARDNVKSCTACQECGACGKLQADLSLHK